MHFECAPEIPEILLSFPILLHLMYFVLLIAIYYEIACPIFWWSSYLASNSKFADALILLILLKVCLRILEFSKTRCLENLISILLMLLKLTNVNLDKLLRSGQEVCFEEQRLVRPCVELLIYSMYPVKSRRQDN